MSAGEDVPAVRKPSVTSEELHNGDLLIYDRENPQAWLQSAYHVEVGPRDNA